MFFQLSFESCDQLKNIQCTQVTIQFKFSLNLVQSIEIKIVSHAMLVSRKLLLTLYYDEISRVRSKPTPVSTCIAFITPNIVLIVPQVQQINLKELDSSF